MENSTDIRTRVEQRREADVPVQDQSETAADLGVWLSGLESFLGRGQGSSPNNSSTGFTVEFVVVDAVLRRCSRLNADMLANDPDNAELREMANVLREALLISDSLTDSHEKDAEQWKAWCEVLGRRLATTSAVQRMVRDAESAGERFLPEQLLRFTTSTSFLSPDHAELALVLPRFAMILRWLSVVGKMLAADEPLKPALVIFARVYEQTAELTQYINNRLERFADQEAELFSSLDAASYTASIELKKVYSQELWGLASVRPSPSVYARMETSYALLNDGFQHIVTGFARLIDPQLDEYKLFPAFATKQDHSVALRDDLLDLIVKVNQTEQDPSEANVASLRTALNDFQQTTCRHLFYKDTETVERFIEETLVTKQNQDLVPILHRFGAYLETLIGQVSLRTVLAKHPQ